MTSIMLIETRKPDGGAARAMLQAAYPKAHLVSASSVGQVHELLKARRWDLLICEPKLEEGSALDVMSAVRLHKPVPPMILLSETGGDPISLELLEWGLEHMVLNSEAGLKRLVPLAQNLLDAHQKSLTEAHTAKQIQSFFTLTLEMLCILDARGRFTYLNPAMGLTLGYRANELLGMDMVSLVHEDDRDGALEAWRVLMEKGGGDQRVIRMRRGEGSYGYFEWYMTAVPEQEIVYAAARDVSAQTQLERQLRDKETRLRSVMDALPQAVFVTNAHGMVDSFNRAAEKLFGQTQAEVYGIRFSNLFRECGLEDLDAFLLGVSDEPVRIPVNGRHRNGKAFDAMLTMVRITLGVDDAFMGMVERQVASQAQSQAVEAEVTDRYLFHQRETLASLASGIAHEFSNLLSPMIGYTEIAMSDLSMGHPAQESLRLVLEATRKARSLIERIYNAGKRRAEMVNLDLQQSLRSAVDVLALQAPENITIHRRIGSLDGCAVKAEDHLISLMILNLGRNAMDAIGRRDGAVTISLVAETVMPDQLNRFHHLREGRYAVIRVEDDGPGVLENEMPHLTMPLFSTKGSGHMGMGLTVVDKLCRKLGGETRAHNSRGKGFCFEIYLPLQEHAQRLESSSKRPRILLVDDEREVTRMLGEILERGGFSVTSRHNGLEALKLFREDVDRFQLLITDQRMPDLTGTRLAEAVTRARPGFKVILISGFGTEELENDLQKVGVNRFLIKPISGKVLLESVRETLGLKT